jgi:hypothetical protein
MSPRDKWEIGPDGSPTSPDHPWNRNRRTSAEVRAEFFKREIERCERGWLSGVAEAVTDAVLLCGEHQAPPPRWLCEAVRVVVERDFLGAATRKWDMIHFARWDAVQELRDRKGERGIPKTWAECYDLASEVLKRTEAHGSAETIRASYKRVAKRIRSQPRNADRYYFGRIKPG